MENIKIVEDARHAPGSVATANLKKDFILNPPKEEFWELTARNFVLNHALQGKSNISILDVGCGTGEQSYDLVNEALLRGLDTNIYLSDLMPANLQKTGKKIRDLAAKRPRNVHSHVLLGDIKKTIPDVRFDLVLLLEVIHWESPEDAQIIFEKLSHHMNPGGELIVSYCTTLNNACLSDTNGNLQIEKSYKAAPIYKKTRYGNWMSFYDMGSVEDMGKKAGLTPYAFEQLDNPYFPTRIGKLQYSFVRKKTSTENEIIAFRKV